MDNLSFNIRENFQDNSVDYAEGQNNSASLGPITPIMPGIHQSQACQIWNY